MRSAFAILDVSSSFVGSFYESVENGGGDFFNPDAEYGTIAEGTLEELQLVGDEIVDY